MSSVTTRQLVNTVAASSKQWPLHQTCIMCLVLAGTRIIWMHVYVQNLLYTMFASSKPYYRSVTVEWIHRRRRRLLKTICCTTKRDDLLHACRKKLNQLHASAAKTNLIIFEKKMQLGILSLSNQKVSEIVIVCCVASC